MDRHLKTLHFDTILEQLMQHAISKQAQEELALLRPITNEALCKLKMAETTSARALLESCGTPPLSPVDNVSGYLQSALSGGMLLPGQLCEVARFASACRRTADYLKRGEGCGPLCVQVAVFGRAFADLTPLRHSIEAAVSEENVYDDASPALRNVRRQMNTLRESIKEKLNHILKTKKAYLADSYISVRGEHYVLPVLKRFKNDFGGTVIEASAKGGTLFMEPTAIRSLQEQLSLLAIEEDAEVRRLLYVLSGEVADAARDVRSNIQLMQQLDTIFAKAKYSAALRAVPAELHPGRRLVIRGGRHPMLPDESCVPLELTMEEDSDGLLITGPNTGGKTLVIKTVGLFCAMAQSGLHIPCNEGSLIPMHDRILCDIGDSQSIFQNLSTFSGHITNVISILNDASRDSLVLLDELGSGTDPAEGMGIALSVLQELWLRGCRYLVTTHDPQVKEYAARTPRTIAARMAFDRETLKPLYRLELGKTGESCALYIARQLGMAEGLLERAKQIVQQKGATSPCDQLRPVLPRPASTLHRQRPQGTDKVQRFTMGDSVLVQPDGETAIVYRPADENGMVIVQVKGEKRAVNHKRLRLHIPASQLYPEDYDFSIIFDTVNNRKAAHQLGRKHDENAVIIHREAKKEE
ncbi:MAG: DNA mismatch repair protein MutS [Clostridiales bacterium]|nr:DNA mismatch repair protein MutS [Clostridiales bacterium]